MAYILASTHNPASLSPRELDNEDFLPSAQFAALNFSSSGPPPSHLNHQPLTHHQPHEHDMAVKDKHQPSLEIIVSSDVLYLKGTGQDVNPALLSGNVVLYLNEPTSLKHITLQFRGKVRIPAAGNEGYVVVHAHFVLCTMY